MTTIKTINKKVFIEGSPNLYQAVTVFNGVHCFTTSAYTAMNVTDLVTLHDRVGFHLPPNWLSSFDAEQNSLIVYQLRSRPVQEGATIYYSLRILSNISWVLHVCGQSLRKLSAAPSTLCSVQDVVGVTDIIDQCKICLGNADEKYVNLIKYHKGVLKDASGLQ